jgi:hypothetical protein
MRKAGRVIRTHIAVGSAGILTLGLVIAPPDVPGVRTEVRPIHLTSVVLTPSEYVGALQKIITNRGSGASSVGSTARGSTAAPVNSGATAPVALNSAAIGPSVSTLGVGDTIGAGIFEGVITVLGVVGTALSPLVGLPVVGPLVLVGFISFVLTVFSTVAFVGVAFEQLAGIFSPLLPGVAPLAATAGTLAKAAPGPTMMSEASVSEPGPGTTPKDAPEDVSKPVKSTKVKTPKKTVTEDLEATEAKTNTSTSAQDPADVEGVNDRSSTSEPTKPKVRPATQKADAPHDVTKADNESGKDSTSGDADKRGTHAATDNPDPKGKRSHDSD